MVADSCVYGFPAADLAPLAAQLASALGLNLYPVFSPMIGPWYASVDIKAVSAAMKQGLVPQLAPVHLAWGRQVDIELRHNADWDSGCQDYPGDWQSVMTVTAQDLDQAALEAALRSAGLVFGLLPRQG